MVLYRKYRSQAFKEIFGQDNFISIFNINGTSSSWSSAQTAQLGCAVYFYGEYIVIKHQMVYKVKNGSRPENSGNLS